LKNKYESILSGKANCISAEIGIADAPFLAAINAGTIFREENQEAVFQSLLLNECDVAVGLEQCFLTQLKSTGMDSKYTFVAENISSLQYHMYVHKNNPALKDILNNGIAELQANGDFSKIYNTWILDADKESKENILMILYIAFAVIVVALISIFISARIRKNLSQQVQERTSELQERNSDLSRMMNRLQQESESRYSIIENLPTSMIMVGSDGKIILANKSAVDLLGTQCIGRHVETIHVLCAIMKQNRNVLSIPEEKTETVAQVVRIEENGVQKTYRFIIFRVPDAEGRNAILIALDDITKEEQEKYQLIEQEKNRALNQLVAGIAHEIKNPLMSIEVFSSQLSSYWDDSEFRDDFIKYVPQESKRATKLINLLINYAKPNVGRKEPIDIVQVIQESMLLSCSTVIKQIHFDLKAEESVAIILADPDQIKQMFVNFFLNAIQAIQEKISTGCTEELYVWIQLRLVEDFVEIRIEDQGIGMTETELVKCTEPFYTTKPTGTGLGMALAKQFVTENEGILDIRSTKGMGTVLLLKFRRYQNEVCGNDY